MPDTSSNLKRVKQLFDACVEQPESTRHHLLAESGANETEIAEVRRLLQIHDAGAVQDRHADIIGRQLQGLSQTLATGQKLGAFEIEGEIGRGGMGIVFSAHRVDGSFEQRVAIKIAPSFASAEELRHFHQERQILAKLQHPNIAMLLDGGATNDQRPYLVMEYVDGHPLGEYCQKQKLDLESRLKLFLAVCDAVSFAHSHLVIHRDIKPDNVLVTAGGQVKLLDFGVSKVLQHDQPNANVTQLKGLTLAYASPEQVRGESTTTATDVYGLGALLYQLLTGHSPHPCSDSSAEKIIDAICVTAPTPPSRTIKDNAVTTAKNLKGDLDNIVGKALRKEPHHRYSSVGELQADIARYLRREPVQATPPSFFYRAGKLVSRYPAASALSLSVFLAISGGFASALYLADRLRNERDNLIQAQSEINRQAHTAERITQLLMDMFTAASPANARGRTIDVEELLDTAIENTQQSLNEERTVKAQLLKTLAQVKFNTGKHQDAVDLQQQAMSILEASQSTDPVAYANDLSKLGDFYREADQLQSSLEALAQASKLLQTQGAAKALAVVQMRQGLTFLQLGKPQLAIDQFKLAEAHWESSMDQGGELGINTRHHLAIAHYDLAEFTTAAQLEESVLEEKLAFYGSAHPKTLSSYQFLGQCYMRINRWGEAANYLEHAYKVGEQIFSEDHVTFRTTGRQYANLLRRLGYYQKATEVLSNLLVVDSQNRESTAHLLNSRGYAYFEQGLMNQARQDLEQSSAIFAEILPDTSSISFLARANLGEAMTRTGAPQAGAELIEKIHRLNAAQYGEDDYGVAGIYFRYARIALNQKRYDDAKTHIAEARRLNEKYYARNHPLQLEVDEVEAQLAVATGDLPVASKRYETLLQRMAEVFPDDAPLIAQIRTALGEVLWRQGQHEIGARMILENAPTLHPELPPHSEKQKQLLVRLDMVNSH